MANHRLFDANRKLLQDNKPYQTVDRLTTGEPYLVWHFNAMLTATGGHTSLPVHFRLRQADAESL